MKKKELEKEWWNIICNLIANWQKSTGKDFIHEYEEMLRGN